jgi:hypothetical protein
MTTANPNTPPISAPADGGAAEMLAARPADFITVAAAGPWPGAPATPLPGPAATAAPASATTDSSGDTDTATGTADMTGVAGLAVAVNPTAEPTSTATQRPVAGTATARVLAEFIMLTSGASLAFGVGRWLAPLAAGTAPPVAGWPGAAPAFALAGWTHPFFSDVLAQSGQAPVSPISLQGFLTNIQWLIFGLLATLTTTFLFIGFARWIAAHEANEYEEAKKSLKNAAKGFVGALLAPTIVSVLQSLVQGPGGR